MSASVSVPVRERRQAETPEVFQSGCRCIRDDADGTVKIQAAAAEPPVAWFAIGGFCGAFAWLLLIFCCDPGEGHTPQTPLFTGAVYAGISGMCCLLALCEDEHPLLASLWRSTVLAGAMMIPFIPFQLLGYMF